MSRVAFLLLMAASRFRESASLAEDGSSMRGGRTGEQPLAKRQRMTGFVHEQTADEIEVHFSGVPVEYTHATLQELHESFGMAPESLLASRFLKRGGKATCCDAFLSYSDAEAAAQAIEELDGQAVANAAGESTYLSARIAEPDRHERRSAGKGCVKGTGKGKGGKSDRPIPTRQGASKGDYGDDGCGGKSNRAGRKGNADNDSRKGSAGPDIIYPSVYVSDVPAEWTDASITDLHESIQIDPSVITGVKFLAPKLQSADTTCCIVRYKNQESANRAVAELAGIEVTLFSGQKKHIGARMAKPARWMLDRTDYQNVGREPSPQRKPIAKACDEGELCIGRAGMKIYADTVNNLAFCEACWRRCEMNTTKPLIPNMLAFAPLVQQVPVFAAAPWTVAQLGYI